MPAPVEVDSEALAGPVGLATGGLGVRDGWRLEAIHEPFNQATGGLYRIRGMASAGRRTKPWSLILKAVHASDGFFGGSPETTHANYWEREPLIYQSGLLEQLPGIRAPRCYGVEQAGQKAAWIWLEDVADGVGSRWSPGHYRLAARRLGEFNGAYLAGRPLPAAGCLSQKWLRSLVASFAPAFAQFPGIRDHPMIRRCWPGDLLDRVLSLWVERDLFLDALERLPQTFCHLDAFPHHLLIEPDREQVVAVDWSYAGMSAIGSELAPMVAASVCFNDAEPEQMGAIDQLAFDGYLAGLREARWDGHPDVVRLGYAAAASLHYGLFPMGVLMVDESMRARLERQFGRTADDIVDRWARVASHLVEKADQARHLLALGV